MVLMSDCDPVVMGKIEAALRDGGRLHAFRSGGGLRVIRIEQGERGGQLVGYGEHPNVGDAFRILADDLAAGARMYADVYGPIETHYLTGSSSPDGRLDAWLLQGATFDAMAADGGFVFELRGLEDHKTPEDIVARARAGETVRYTDETRGVVYETKPYRFPNGDIGSTTSAVHVPEGMSNHRAWMWYAVRMGRGATLAEAISAAFDAQPVEEIDS